MSYRVPHVKQLPFRAAILAKLNLILMEYGSRSKAAKMMEVNPSLLSRWMRETGDPKCGPPVIDPKNAEIVDRHYYICWEKRLMRAHKSRLRPKYAALARKEDERAHNEEAAVDWTDEAMRQSAEGNDMPFDPPLGVKEKPLT